METVRANSRAPELLYILSQENTNELIIQFKKTKTTRRRNAKKTQKKNLQTSYDLFGKNGVPSSCSSEALMKQHKRMVSERAD
jgi:hypothetical protein